MNDRTLQFLGRCHSWPLGWRLALSVAIVLLATLLRVLLTPEIANRLVYVTYFPAVAIVTMMAGTAGGVLAVALALAGAHLTAVGRSDVADLIGAALFVAASAIIVGMAHLLHRARARMAAAEAARRGKELLLQFTRQAPLALAMLDGEMRYIATSRRWLDDRGIDRDLTGLSHYEVFPWVSEAWREAHRRALEGEVVRSEEELIRRADGGERWQRWEVRPWRHADGGIGGVIIFSEDITARKLAEEKVRRSEALFRATFENSAVGMAQISPSGMFLGVNRRLCDTLGYTADELCRRSFADITHPDDLAAHLALRKRLLAGECDQFGGEGRYIRKNGSCLWGSLSVGAVRDTGGPGGYAVAVIEDISERKRIEAALQESEARHRSIVDTAFASIVTVDEHGIVRSANPATRTIFGYAPDELIGASFAKIMPETPGYRHGGHMEAYRRTSACGMIGVGQELTALRKDGAPVDIELVVSEWRDAAGERFFTGTMRDITARKQAEDALRKFSRVIEQTASAVVIADANGIIEYVNPRFSETSGYAAEEAIGQRTNLLKSGHTADAEYGELWRTITGGGVWRGEFRNRRKDGSLFWESTIISPIRAADGRISHFAAVKDDITGRKEIEEQFVAAQRLETVGRLAGSIAHDFNNLLAVIAGNLDLIRLRNKDPRIEALVRPALNAAEAGAAFNRRLLSLGGRRRFEPRPVVVNERIRDARILLECSLGAGIVIGYDLADDLWPTVTDPGEIDSALLNLVTNSKDAMPHGGEITIQTRNAALDAAAASSLRRNAPAGDYVRISVTDKGEGMRKEVLERAAEPFFTTKSEGRGTGLGLSSVNNFVTQAGGFVVLDSRSGAGTTVHLYLPRAPIKKQAETPARNVPYGDGEVVLVVEDDERVLDVTLNRVEALGYVAEAARSGEEALEVLKSGIGIDAILSDVVMPGGMTGFELARRVRSAAPNVRIVLATGFSGNSTADHVALDAPILHKPYSLEELAAALAAALAGRSQAAETSAVKT